jgi:hypothetical protein
MFMRAPRCLKSHENSSKIGSTRDGGGRCNNSDFPVKSRSGECELWGLPVYRVDFLGADVAKQKR